MSEMKKSDEEINIAYDSDSGLVVNYPSSDMNPSLISLNPSVQLMNYDYEEDQGQRPSKESDASRSKEYSWDSSLSEVNMDIRSLKSYEDIAINLVVSIINKAQEKLGVRQNLFQIAHSRNVHQTFLPLATLVPPLAYSSEKLLKNAIEKVWKLTECLRYHLKYLGGSQDEVSQYFYFEVIFSQPVVAYPIAQTTASVFFRVEEKHVDRMDGGEIPLPEMVFRLEGHHTDHDVRFVKVTVDMILSVMMMKLDLFSRIEDIKMF